MPVALSKKCSLYLLVRKLWKVHCADCGVLREHGKHVASKHS